MFSRYEGRPQLSSPERSHPGVRVCHYCGTSVTLYRETSVWCEVPTWYKDSSCLRTTSYPLQSTWKSLTDVRDPRHPTGRFQWLIYNYDGDVVFLLVSFPLFLPPFYFYRPFASYFGSRFHHPSPPQTTASVFSSSLSYPLLSSLSLSLLSSTLTQSSSSHPPL